MTEPTLSELADEGDRLAKDASEPPWFAGEDEARDAPAHKGSGLALVDTGRESDWPIARLAEWPQAKFIAWLGSNWPMISAALREAEKEIARLATEREETYKPYIQGVTGNHAKLLGG